MNNKVYIIIKIFLFITNYNIKLRIKIDIKKRKY